MDLIRLCISLILQCFILSGVMCIQKREWVGSPTAKLTEGDVACYSEYMEMWIHGARIEGLEAWLSGALRIQVNLASLDQLNLQLSACGYSLHKDPDQNFIFRVSYTGCFLQQQRGFHVLTLNLVKRINRFGGRRHSFIMTCPVVSVLPDREKIQCDPENIQVIRQVPHDNWNNELQWDLSLSDHLIVAMEDASLLQMNIVTHGSDIIVQGRRREILSPVKVMEDEVEFLALKLVSGQYAYSMEAMCPTVTSSTAEETVLHIFKRRLGLTKRGSTHTEELTLSDVSVNQTQNFTVHQTSEFVSLIIPTTQILQTKTCTDSKQLLQSFYRVDVVLTFKETNHKMHWTMENTLPCTAKRGAIHPNTIQNYNTLTEDKLTKAMTKSVTMLRYQSKYLMELEGKASAGPAASYVTSSPAPHITVLPSLTFINTTLSTERAAVPTDTNRTAPLQETTMETSTIRPLPTQTEGGWFDSNTEEVTKSPSGNSSSGSYGDVVTPTHANVTDLSVHTHEHFNSTRGNQDQRQQKKVKWIW